MKRCMLLRYSQDVQLYAGQMFGERITTTPIDGIADRELQNAREVNFTRCFDEGWERRDHRIEILAPVAATA
jgi:hypothetical protein